MRRWRFWLRWSLRDLRSRWMLVVAIALVIAIGTGMFTGLGSLETWRTRSNDESFARLNAHDLKVTLAEGSLASAGDLTRAGLCHRPTSRSGPASGITLRPSGPTLCSR